MPEDATEVLARTQFCHGFYGASSMERLPTEVAIRDQITAFRQIDVRGGESAARASARP